LKKKEGQLRSPLSKKTRRNHAVPQQKLKDTHLIRGPKSEKIGKEGNQPPLIMPKEGEPKTDKKRKRLNGGGAAGDFWKHAKGEEAI